MPDIDMPSRQTLDELPGRALEFLSAASRSQVIFASLAARGYDMMEHERVAASQSGRL